MIALISCEWEQAFDGVASPGKRFGKGGVICSKCLWRFDCKQLWPWTSNNERASR